jgi:hypothetical protein
LLVLRLLVWWCFSRRLLRVVLRLLLVLLFRVVCPCLLSRVVFARRCCLRLVRVLGRLFVLVRLRVVSLGCPLLRLRCFPSFSFRARFFSGVSLHTPKSKKETRKGRAARAALPFLLH